jgi:predicted adenylyl cyclase CyaB
MNRNVEIKARVESLEAVERRVREMADEGPVTLVQEDTFFICPQGRLKLRKLGARQGELIYYERPDSAEPKESRYAVFRTSDPEGLAATLSLALGWRGIVRKTRTLYLVGPTRVHLDSVEGLGDFVELEVVLRPDQSVSEGTTIAHDLMAKLGISPGQLVRRAYIDLLEDLS